MSNPVSALRNVSKATVRDVRERVRSHFPVVPTAEPVRLSLIRVCPVVPVVMPRGHQKAKTEQKMREKKESERNREQKLGGVGNVPWSKNRFAKEETDRTRILSPL